MKVKITATDKEMKKPKLTIINLKESRNQLRVNNRALKREINRLKSIEVAYDILCREIACQKHVNVANLTIKNKHIEDEINSGDKVSLLYSLYNFITGKIKSCSFR